MMRVIQRSEPRIPRLRMAKGRGLKKEGQTPRPSPHDHSRDDAPPCPHFAHTFPGTSGKLRETEGYHTVRSHAQNVGIPTKNGTIPSVRNDAVSVPPAGLEPYPEHRGFPCFSTVTPPQRVCLPTFCPHSHATADRTSPPTAHPSHHRTGRRRHPRSSPPTHAPTGAAPPSRSLQT